MARRGVKGMFFEEIDLLLQGGTILAQIFENGESERKRA
jgi:hypothetical protein